MRNTKEAAAAYGRHMDSVADALAHVRDCQPRRTPAEEPDRYAHVAARLAMTRDQPVPHHVIWEVAWGAASTLADRPIGLGSWRHGDGRAQALIAYAATAYGRPDKTSDSPYNPAPQLTAAAWALRLPAGDNRWQYLPALPIRWAGNRRRIRAMLRLGGAWARTQAPGDVIPVARWWGALQGQLRTAEVRRLARLPKWAIRAIAWVDFVRGRRVAWDVVADALRPLTPDYRAALQAARIPAVEWLSPHLVAAWEVARKPVVLRTVWRGCGRQGNWRAVRTLDAKLSEGRRFLRALATAGLGDTADVPLRFAVDAAQALSASAKPLSWAALIEAVDAAGGHVADVPTAQSERTSVRASGRPARATDRLAQADPDWAVSRFPGAYALGRKVAPVIGAAVRWLAARAAGRPVVVYGRDGEIVHHVATRLGLPTRYVLASRSLLTAAQAGNRRVREMLCRQVPDGAMHVDTGFAGSVPERVMSIVGVSGEIWLLSAENGERQIPGLDEVCPETALRDFVLECLEHVPHRLDKPTDTGEIRYSAEPAIYWSRLYGACDALGLPRQVRGRA